jgi:ketosteroid isomerase-like protein
MCVLKFLILSAALLMSASGVAFAQPQPATPEEVVTRHIAAFDKHDVEGLIADYGDDVVIVMSSQIIHGKEATKAWFTKYFASANMPKFDARLDRVEGDTGVTLWVVNPGSPNAKQGNDVFVIRDGKIRFQTTTGVRPVDPPK